MRAVAVIVICGSLAAACTSGQEPTTTTTLVTTTTETTSDDPGFYLNLVWHQHQPFYPKDDTGTYTRPWVRLHAAKDYVDMVDTVLRHPGLRVTFNLTPTLLLQLDDLAAGAEDSYRAAAQAPAASLDETERRFIVERFFDVNPRIVARFPRFQELADDRQRIGIDGAVADWTTEQFRDLQVLFDLAWTDPAPLGEPPLAELVARGRDYTEEDKSTVASVHDALVAAVIPRHREAWQEGAVEITTTPYAHPILPLLADTDLAAVGDTTAILPGNRFRFLQDAAEQVRRGLAVAEGLLGRRPAGMWPGEGSVAQLVTGLYLDNGVEWVSSGEEVLAATLGIGSFTRDGNGLVDRPDLLYRPWQAQVRGEPALPMFFRDGTLSDLIGFQYSGSDAAAAADDFMSRLAAIRAALEAGGLIGGERPPVVTVILDGENAWEHYANDGKDFLDALYGRLTAADWVATITPSEYLSRFATPEPLAEVWPGAWFQANFSTWIGEEEEATAWDYLYAARQDLRRAEQSPDTDPEALEAARNAMYLAEGSDWFWWYGTDQDSGNDSYFDQAFRDLIAAVYEALDMERPSFLDIPIIAQPPLPPDSPPGGSDEVTIDGSLDDWGGGRYLVDDAEVGYAFDREHLYLAWIGAPSPDPLLVYLGAPRGRRTAAGVGGEALGFGATATLAWTGDRGACLFEGVPTSVEVASGDGCVPVPAASTGEGIEIAVPLTEVGAITSGDLILARIEASGDLLPAGGPMAFQVPDISNVEALIEVLDPIGDDHGPGMFTYPLDPVFIDGSYDLASFTVGTEADDVVFAFEVAAPILNPWGSPRQLSVQTFDVYVDVDPDAGTGRRLLLPGRNAALPSGNGWDYAVTVEGWDPAIYVAEPDGTATETKPTFDIVTFGDTGRVVVRVPRSLLGGGDPATWRYAAVVLSQEGFPSPGVRRVRDIALSAEQWRLGGGSAALNETRIIDVAWPVPGEQEALLSDHTAVASGDVDDLGADEFGSVPMLGD